MTKSKYGRIIALTTTVCIILLGIIFIACTAHMFFTGGEQPYSRERAGKYLLALAVPSVITLAAVICGIVYNLTTGEKDVENTKRTSSEQLDSLTSRYDFNAFPEQVRSEAIKERDLRQTVQWIAYDISFLLICVAVVYFDLFTSFSVDNLNGDVLLALAGILPLSVLAVAVHIPKAYMIEASAKRELNLLKESIKLNGAPATISKAETNNSSRIAIARYVVAGIAILLVVLGIINGGMADVLAKAVKICTECIGLG